MEEFNRRMIGDKTNFVFLGEAGSGKSEIAINFARYLAEWGEKPVHFFDMDMTKPLFRSRDVTDQITSLGISFHHEEQFYDAPTMVGGVNLHLKDDNCYVVMDVGGNDTGARAVGGFAPKLNGERTIVYYVMNAFRPWSMCVEAIDGTLSAILGSSHIRLEQLHIVNNPNNGITTTAAEFLEGLRNMEQMMEPYLNVDFACVMEELYDKVRGSVEGVLMPLRLYLTYPWLKEVAPEGQKGARA